MTRSLYHEAVSTPRTLEDRLGLSAEAKALLPAHRNQSAPECMSIYQWWWCKWNAAGSKIGVEFELMSYWGCRYHDMGSGA